MDDELYACLLPPYEESFANIPTDCCSNGRLIIDFLAESLGLPLIPAFVRKGPGTMVMFKQGVNYAVASATALSALFLKANWIEKSVNNPSLKTQLTWFQESLPYISGSASGSGRAWRDAAA